jgi:hypothetical protein
MRKRGLCYNQNPQHEELLRQDQISNAPHWQIYGAGLPSAEDRTLLLNVLMAYEFPFTNSWINPSLTLFFEAGCEVGVVLFHLVTPFAFCKMGAIVALIERFEVASWTTTYTYKQAQHAPRHVKLKSNDYTAIQSQFTIQPSLTI